MDRMSLAEYFLLAIASIFWPLLLAIVVVALRTEHPVKLLAAFLAGGLLTTISIGLAIVFSLQSTSFGSGSNPPANPAIDITAGVLTLIAAAVLRRVWVHSGPREPKPETSDGKLEHYLSNVRLAFFAGIVLNILPGFVPFVALKNIAVGDYTDATKVLLVVVFYVIMFSSVEVPIVGHAIAPARTDAAMERINSWIDRNGRQAATFALALIGVYLVVRGLFAL